ncbi:MAG: Rab family GTPase [Candidatus Thorarchaeota archaeon]
MSEQVYAFKLIVIGPGAVGKSSLIRRFVENKFSLHYKFTIGVDFMTKTVEFEPGKSAKLTLWDIGGQERFKVLRRSFYEGTNGALVVFDLSRANTFIKMKEWLSDARQSIENDFPVIIIGNKSDLIPEIGEIIDRNDPLQYAKAENSIYIETSAKTGDNVDKAFIDLTQKMVEKSK